MNSIKTLAGWQAAALSLAICVFFVAQHNTEHNGDLPALLVLGTTFGITLISALVAAITWSALPSLVHEAGRQIVLVDDGSGNPAPNDTG